VNEEYVFEDFAVGQVFRSGEARIEREGIKRFAAEFDPQPMHLDEAAARSSLFGDLVASGWHTAAIAMRLNLDGGMPPIAGGLIGAGIEHFAWPRPVRPGDTLNVSNEVIAVRASRSRPDKGLVTVRTIARNQRDEPVLELTATLIVPRRDG
jgi:acyl dehydratase